ncbi:hypothetical protein MA16_Dca028157 [Dendrobium catenatum]|uniref:Uncharacterized protein n=1 Tax=Dendrobium catenatum TaxID=906689 RepID=A0A2I0VA94_9ASPA|nr:hypothetical protein MA16_Dca028157 [Dendrobium catenatum]
MDGILETTLPSSIDSLAAAISIVVACSISTSVPSVDGGIVVCGVFEGRTNTLDVPGRLSLNANNCCIDLIASTTCADVVEMSGDNFVSLVDGDGETLAEMGNAGVVEPLVDVPLFVILNVDMLAHC